MIALLHAALIADTPANKPAANPLVTLAPILLIGVVFYFLLIRPQQRRARSQRELVRELGVGDDVVTVGGMFGTIRAVDDESVTVEGASGT
jgi:preprotein translocase subunit YajC